MESEMAKWLSTGFKYAIINLFHRMYYKNPEASQKNTFLGYGIQQCPFDLQLYQEIITRLKPSFILQTGVAHGGSVLYFATLLDLIGADKEAKVIGVDVTLFPRAKTLSHPRIHLIEGSSTDEKTLEKIKALLPAKGGLVSLDSDHSKKHVLKELKLYTEFVDIGSYLVVEDTNINGHPVLSRFGDGPYEAVQEFLKKDSHFVQDNDLWQRNLFSFHQYGWLKRTR